MQTLYGWPLLLFSLLACTAPQQNSEKPMSPFAQTPADIARETPCRFPGTFRKESRQRLEELRARKVIDLEEWKCMAQALKTLDEHMGELCKKKKQSLAIIETRQRELYSTCISASNQRAVQCALLSSEEPCT